MLDFQVFPHSSSLSEDGLDIGFEGVDDAAVLYCERFMEFLIDLLSQLPTRRLSPLTSLTCNLVYNVLILTCQAIIPSWSTSAI